MFSNVHVALTQQREMFPSHLRQPPLYISSEEGKKDKRNEGEVKEERDVEHLIFSAFCEP